MADRRDVIAKEDVWNHGDIVAHWRWDSSRRCSEHGDIVAHWRWGSSKRCSESWSMEIEGLVGGGMA